MMDELKERIRILANMAKDLGFSIGLNGDRVVDIAPIPAQREMKIIVDHLPRLLRALQNILNQGKLPHTLIYGHYRYSIISDDWYEITEACRAIGMDMSALDEGDD